MKRDRKVQLALDRITLSGGFMGAAEVADALGIHVPNIGWTKIEPVARISRDRIPIYLAADVAAVLKERKEKKA